MKSEMMLKLKYGHLNQGLFKICTSFNYDEYKIESNQPTHVKIITNNYVFSIYNNVIGRFDVFAHDSTDSTFTVHPKRFSFPTEGNVVNFIQCTILGFKQTTQS